jgi:hypothetical protein
VSFAWLLFLQGKIKVIIIIIITEEFSSCKQCDKQQQKRTFISDMGKPSLRFQEALSGLRCNCNIKRVRTLESHRLSLCEHSRLCWQIEIPEVLGRKINHLNPILILDAVDAF